VFVAVLIEVAFVCLFVCLFVLFQVPLISCASTWRAGVTKNGARPKFKPLLHKVQSPRSWLDRFNVLHVYGYNSR
jgi:hypothetical protein